MANAVTRLTDAATVTPLSAVAATPQTSLVTLMSTDHGRKRREERGILKRDLKSALLHGKREPAHPCPRTGARRWKFTFGEPLLSSSRSSPSLFPLPPPAAAFTHQPQRRRH